MKLIYHRMVLIIKIFLGWSGEVSRAVAEALNWWLPKVIQSIEQFYSNDDIKKGAGWFSKLAQELRDAKVGIICLTKDNFQEPWILFEAGAIWKAFDNHVCTYLFKIDPISFSGPLSEFQHTKSDKEDTRRLIHTLNDIMRKMDEKPIEKGELDEIFEVWWPKLETRLNSIPENEVISRPRLEEREILEELLERIRYQEKVCDNIDSNCDIILDCMGRGPDFPYK